MLPHSRAFLELVKVYLTCKAYLLFYLSSCIFPLHQLGAKWAHLLTIALTKPCYTRAHLHPPNPLLTSKQTLSTRIESTGNISALFNDRKNPSINIVLFFYLLYNLLQNRLGYTFYKFHIQMQ